MSNGNLFLSTLANLSCYNISDDKFIFSSSNNYGCTYINGNYR